MINVHLHAQWPVSGEHRQLEHAVLFILPNSLFEVRKTEIIYGNVLFKNE